MPGHAYHPSHAAPHHAVNACCAVLSYLAASCCAMLCCAGDEVVDPATAQLGPGQIRDCNRAMLLAAVASAGAEAVDLGIARDVEGHLEGAVDKAIAVGTDVLVTTGVWVGGWVGVGDSGDRRMGWVGGGDSGNKGLGLVWVWVWVLSDPTPRTMGLLRQASCASCLDVRPM